MHFCNYFQHIAQTLSGGPSNQLLSLDYDSESQIALLVNTEKTFWLTLLDTLLWVVKAWRSEDVALYGKVVSPPSPNSQ